MGGWDSQGGRLGFIGWAGGIHRDRCVQISQIMQKNLNALLRGGVEKDFSLLFASYAMDDYSFWNFLSLGGQNSANTSYIVMKIILSQYLRADLLVDDRQIDF